MNTIKVLSWNVEHFKKGKQQEVAEIIRGYDPDIFAIYEVEGKTVYSFIKTHFPGYTVFITTGQQRQEILIACKNNNRYIGIRFQQKDAFKSGNPYLRPGVLLSFDYADKGEYHFLFLHTDSGTSAVDFGNRTEMFQHGYSLKRKKDHEAGKKVNFMMMGDLNTMGLRYPTTRKSDNIVKTPDELEYLDYYANRSAPGARSGYKKLKPALKRLSKPAGTYYGKTYGISDLDHIIVSEHMQFTLHNNFGETEQHEVKLDGWRQHLGNEDAMNEYVKDISDHCLLYCEVKV